MNAVHELWRNLYRFHTASWIEAAVAAAKTEDFGDTVPVVQFKKKRANDIV